MTRLLALAIWLCGEAAGRQTFDPLLADWDRELRDAQAKPLAVRAGVVIRGAATFATTLLVCSARLALVTEGSMWRYGIAAFVVAVMLAMVAEAALIGTSIPADYPPDMLLMATLRIGGAAAVAPAMLPALLLLRRGATGRFAVAGRAIALGAGVAVLGVIAQPWLADLQPTAGQNERMYQRLRANDRAGRLQYPGTALRDLRDATSTVEERRARYEQFKDWRSQQAAKEPPGPSTWHRLRRSTLPVMAALFGLVGWNLGAVARPTITRALIWWGLAWLLTLIANGRMTNMLGLPGFWFTWWTMPAVTAVASLALMLAGARQSTDRSPHHAINRS